MIIEELEDIYSEVSVFQKYIKINLGLVASQGAERYVGKILADGLRKAEVLCNKCIEIPVESFKATAWFYLKTITI